LAAAVAVPAHAAAKAPVARAIAAASQAWGATPCGGDFEILKRQVVRGDVEPGSDAWSRFNTPLGANNLTASASDYTDCTIALGRVRWPSRSSMVEDWDMLCMTMTHEFGHLLGHAHDTTFGSVMVPVFTDYSSEPDACRSNRPRSAPAS
jgi:hypothetical protein